MQHSPGRSALAQISEVTCHRARAPSGGRAAIDSGPLRGRSPHHPVVSGNTALGFPTPLRQLVVRHTSGTRVISQTSTQAQPARAQSHTNPKATEGRMTPPGIAIRHACPPPLETKLLRVNVHSSHSHPSWSSIQCPNAASHMSFEASSPHVRLWRCRALVGEPGAVYAVEGSLFCESVPLYSASVRAPILSRYDTYCSTYMNMCILISRICDLGFWPWAAHGARGGLRGAFLFFLARPAR